MKKFLTYEVKQANIRVDGYNFDNEPNRLSVTLAILDFNSDDEYKNLIGKFGGGGKESGEVYNRVHQQKLGQPT